MTEITEQNARPSGVGEIAKGMTNVGWVCLTLTVVCELGLVFFVGRAFYVIPPGTHIRPMGLAFVIGLLTLSLWGTACVVGFLVAAVGWKSWRNWILGGVIFTLGYSLPWVIWTVIHTICDMHNLVLKD